MNRLLTGTRQPGGGVDVALVDLHPVIIVIMTNNNIFLDILLSFI